MNKAVKQKTTPDLHFSRKDALEAHMQSGLGKGFERERLQAFDRFSKASLPDESHELWRHTKIEQFELSRIKTPVDIKFSLCEWGNTIKNTAPSSIKGVSLNTSSTDTGVFDKIFVQYPPNYGSSPFYNPISDLHTSLLHTAFGVTISADCNPSMILHLSSVLTGAENGGSAPLIVIKLEKGASATIIEDLSFELPLLYMPWIEIVLEDGAHLDFTSIQRLPTSSDYLARHRIHAGRDALGNFNYMNIGAGASRLDMDCLLHGAGSSIKFMSVFLADSDRHLDFHPTQYHLAPHCSSDLLTKGILKDSARSVYYGYIRVAEGAQKTDAYQTSRNLILSEQARADSIPNLEIKANDVKCSHGASVGQVNEEELFYLRTRGLSLIEAERLLVEGFLEDLLRRIKTPQVYDYMHRLILDRV